MPAQTTKAPPRSGVFLRHRKKILALFVLLLVVGIDIVAGTLLIRLGLFRPADWVEQRYRTAHPVFHHTLRPDVQFSEAAWGRIGYRLSTNSLGFKDRAARKIELTSDRHRVLIIGDSFTEGVGLSYEETFVGLVDDRLAQGGVEVLNAGVASYSPLLYFRKIRHLLDEVGLEVGEVVVFLDISDILDDLDYYVDENDRVRSPRHESFRRASKRWLNRHTILIASTRAGIRSFGERFKDPRDVEWTLDRRQSRWTIDDDDFEKKGRPGLDICAEWMDRLAELLRSRGIPLTLAVYPWPDQVFNRDLDSRHVVFWRTWAGRNDVAFVDLFPAFIDEREPLEVLQRLFIRGDYHWNAAGHEVVARQLLEHWSPAAEADRAR
ncbi:MAG: hypothetical protein GY716_01755 [bacterium]|nr:hypothetical protein [bacterium]